MLKELRNNLIHETHNSKHMKRKRTCLDITVEPAKKKIHSEKEGKIYNTATNKIFQDTHNKETNHWKVDFVPEIIEVCQGHEIGRIQQQSAGQLSEEEDGIAANCSERAKEESCILEEERYGDLLESLIASVSPDELLFKHSIGNEIPENFISNEIPEKSNGNEVPEDLIGNEIPQNFGDEILEIFAPSGLEPARSSCMERHDEDQTGTYRTTADHISDYKSRKSNLTVQERVHHLEATTEKFELFEKLRLDNEQQTPSQLSIERRHLAVMLEDLLEEVDLLTCSAKGPEGKEIDQRKKVLNRRLQSLAHFNSCAIDERSKQQYGLFGSKKQSDDHQEDVSSSKRSQDLVLHIEDGSDPCEEGFKKARKDKTPEKRETKFESTPECVITTQADKLLEPSAKPELERNVMVKGPSEENEAKLPDVFASSPKNFPQEGFSEITKGKSTKIEKLVTPRGLSFMLQFETLSGENLVQENAREGPVAKRRRFDRNQMEYMEEVKPEWRKAHRGAVNWARKLEVEATLEQEASPDLSAAGNVSTEDVERTPRKVFKQGRRPEKERRCERWLIDQDLLQDLLKQTIPDPVSEDSPTNQSLSSGEEGTCSGESATAELSSASPHSLDALGEELLQRLADKEDSSPHDLLLRAQNSDLDFSETEDDDNEDDVQRLQRQRDPCQDLDMPMLDLL